MNFQDQLRYRLQQMNEAEKLILINFICFVLPLFLKTILYLFNIPSGVMIGWFELSVKSVRVARDFQRLKFLQTR